MHIDWINGSARIKIQQEIRIVTGGNRRYKNERLVFFTMAALTMDFGGSDIGFDEGCCGVNSVFPGLKKLQIALTFKVIDYSAFRLLFLLLV